MTTPPDLPNRPILLIEDEAMDIDLTLQAFAQARVSNPVVICRDGDVAKDFINAHTAAEDPQLPIVALLDLHLPKVDGLEVLRHARKQSPWKQIPFVIMTSSLDTLDITNAYELGANSYIVKPISFVAFAEVVTHIKAYWLLTNVPPFAHPVLRPL